MLTAETTHPHPGARAIPTAPGGTVIAVVASLVATWLAAGSTGIVAEPLRVALTWTALAIALIAAWPPRGRLLALVAAAAVMLLLPEFLATRPVHLVLTVAALVSLLAAGQSGLSRRILLVTAVSIALFGLYRLAYGTIPLVWHLADMAGRWCGVVAGALTGKPLRLGATFGGVDYLVLMTALIAGWLALTPAPRRHRAIYAVVAVLLAHLAYLIVLTFATDLLAALPTPPVPPDKNPYTPPPWRWSAAIRVLLPWNVPALAAFFDALITIVMLRWATWLPVVTDVTTAGTTDSRPDDRSPVGTAKGRRWPNWAAMVLAAATPLVVVLAGGRSDLGGKTVLVNQRGYLDWRKPRHGSYGQQSAGLYGMLPTFVESLGGRFVFSSDFSAAELDAADVVIVLNPTQPWKRPQLDRIWRYVHRGGSLLVAAGPVVRQGDLSSTSNDVLRPTRMHIRQDVAISATDAWQHACQVTAHPATVAVNRTRPEVVSDWGASIDVGWPAAPLLVGQWGWSDPGSDALLTTSGHFEAGEKLGDLVLAAEQRLGKGTVVVLGDSAVLNNESIDRSWRYVGRLLSYLAGKWSTPQRTWRQILGLLLVFLLGALLVTNGTGGWLAAAMVLLAISLATCMSVSRRVTRVVPDLPAGASASLAYIDASHLEAYSDLIWGFDGVDGLALNLMRNDFLPLRLYDLAPARINRAALLVVIAPARAFSASERRTLGQWVAGGGVLVFTVGAEEAAASASLLGEFGIQVPRSPVPTSGHQYEPEPMGRFRGVYLRGKDPQAGDYQVGVRFFAGWPVLARTDDVEVLVRGSKNRPIVVARKIGKGTVVVIGDTSFAMNKNLEYIGGEPFAGQYENADFWRWLIARVTGRPEWVPPPPPQEPSASGKAPETPGKKTEADGKRSQPQQTPAPAAQRGAAQRVGPKEKTGRAGQDRATLGTQQDVAAPSTQNNRTGPNGGNAR